MTVRQKGGPVQTLTVSDWRSCLLLPEPQFVATPIFAIFFTSVFALSPAPFTTCWPPIGHMATRREENTGT